MGPQPVLKSFKVFLELLRAIPVKLLNRLNGLFQEPRLRVLPEHGARKRAWFLENNLRSNTKQKTTRSSQLVFPTPFPSCRVIDDPPNYFCLPEQKAVVQACSRGVHVCVIRKRHAERLDSEGLANEPRRPHTRPPLISTNCSPINYAHTVELIRRWHYYPVDCRLRYRALRRSATIYGDRYRRISVSRRSSLVSRGWIARSRIGPILLFVSMLFRSLLFRSRVKPLQPNFTLNFLFVVEGSNRSIVSWIRVAFESSLSSSNALEFLVKIIRRKK